MLARFVRDTLLQSTKNVLSETGILFRSSHQRCSIKKLLINISQYSQESTYVPWSLFNKVPGLKPRNFIQNRLQHRFFLWILQNFKEHLFWRTSENRYFSLFQVNSLKHLKKSRLKPKWQNKFENTLHAAQVMKRNH